MSKDTDDDRMTLPQAAEVLNVSRKYAQELADKGQLGSPVTQMNSSPTFAAEIVNRLGKQLKVAQREGLEEMKDASARLGQYDDELRGLPTR